MRNRGGSVEHYYHFLLGYLVPLCGYLAAHRPRSARLLIRSCGPMDRLIRELAVPALDVLPRETHARLGRSVPGEPDGLAVELAGTDLDRDHGRYRHASISTARRFILGRYRGPIARHRRRLEQVWPSRRERILLVERGRPDPFYVSPRSERKWAGRVRRHIPNLDAVQGRLRAAVGPCLRRQLERATLAEQVALFQLADVVVAQHGAALANAIWMRPGTGMVEIVPGGGSHPKGQFRRLARAGGLGYRMVPQRAAHAPVDPGAVVDAVERLRAARGRPSRGGRGRPGPRPGRSA